MTMDPKECPSFHNCSAPLCPLDKQSQEVGQWFPTEDICKSQMKKPRWVTIQRRIQKKVGKTDKVGYWTVAMLNAMGAVSARSKGIGPDKWDTASLEASFIKRRRVRLFSEEERRELREKVKNARLSQGRKTLPEK